MSRLLVVATLLLSPAGADDSDRVAALTKALNHGSYKARVEAARELGRVGGKQVIAVLTQALDAENETLRHAVALALVTSGSKESDVVAVLRTSLRAKAWYRRWDAVHALTTIGRKARSAVPDLIGVHESRDPILARHSIVALEQIAPDVGALLWSLTRGPDRSAVLSALKDSGYKVSGVVRWYIRRIDDSGNGNAANRMRALVDLRGLGKRAREAIPAVCAWFASPNKRERDETRATLRAIGAGTLCDLILWGDAEKRRAADAGPMLADAWWRVSRRLRLILEDKTIGEPTRRQLAKLQLTTADRRRFAAVVSSCVLTRNIRCGLLLVPLFIKSPEDAAGVARKFTEHKSEAVRLTAREALLRIEQRKAATKK